MLVVTTPTVEGAPIKRYIGMVSGETIAGVNVFKDFGASLSNVFGGRASQYEEELGNASATAVNEMCARAVHGCERGRRRQGRLLYGRHRQRHACRHRDGHCRHPLISSRAAVRATDNPPGRARTRPAWRVVAMVSCRERGVPAS